MTLCHQELKQNHNDAMQQKESVFESHGYRGGLTCFLVFAHTTWGNDQI